jgi:hypothetical protein
MIFISSHGGERILTLFSIFLASLLLLEIRSSMILPQLVREICSYTGTLSYMIAAPPFYHALCMIPPGPRLRWLYGAAWGSCCAWVIAGLVSTDRVSLCIGIELFLMVAWGLLMVIVRFKNIGDVLQKRFIKRFFIVSAASFPLMLADMLGSRLGWRWIAWFDELSLPIFLLAVDTLILMESGRWLQRIPNSPVPKEKNAKGKGHRRGYPRHRAQSPFPVRLNKPSVTRRSPRSPIFPLGSKRSPRLSSTGIRLRRLQSVWE